MKGENFTRTPDFEFRYNINNDSQIVEASNSIPNSISLDLSGVLENFLFNPFCIDWNLDLIEDFLIKCGYSIATKRINDEEFRVAYNNQINLNDVVESNVMEVFQTEVQQVLLKWLLNLKNDKNGINKN